VGANGPLLRDRLWFALAGELVAPEAGSLAPSWLGKVTWQATSRNKVTLLGLAAHDGSQARQSLLGGLRWESLLSDALVSRVHVATRSLRGPQGLVQGREAGLHLEWFLHDEHSLRLALKGDDLTWSEPAAIELRRAAALLEEHWQVSRYLRLAAGATLSSGRHRGADTFTTGTGMRPAPRLGLAWDVTRDGRTALRASLGQVVDLGSLTTPAPHPRAATWEAALTGEREVLEETVLAVDLAARLRPQRLPGDDRPTKYQHLGLRLRLPLDGLRLRASWLLERADAVLSQRARLVGTVALMPGLHLGFLLAHDDRDAWLRLMQLDHETLVAQAGPAQFIVAAQLRCDLGVAFDLPVVLAADAFTLPGQAATFRLTASTGY
jgi:hypothetical protein